MMIKPDQIPERPWVLEGDAKWMLPTVEDTLEDNADGEVRARLCDRTEALEDLADLLDDVAEVFVIMVEEGSCEKSTK